MIVTPSSLFLPVFKLFARFADILCMENNFSFSFFLWGIAVTLFPFCILQLKSVAKFTDINHMAEEIPPLTSDGGKVL